MGTMLQQKGLPPGSATEIWNIESPDIIEEIHRQYANAGAQILTTNTFGASKLKLSQYGIAAKQKELIYAAVELARKAAGNKDICIAGDIGPLGTFMQPFGELTFDEAYAQFKEYASHLAAAGADLLLIETMTDLLEMKAAYFACRDAAKIPVFITFSFDEGDRSVTGTPPDVFAAVANALKPDALGTNCGKGIEPVIVAVKAMRPLTDGLLIAQPNAGMPTLQDWRTIFPATPREMADAAETMRSLGANIIGSCCGSTPEHTALIADAVRGKRVTSHQQKPAFFAASRTKLLRIGYGNPIALIGERINPSGRKKFKQDLKNGDIGAIKLEAVRQENANALDVCVATAGVDELRMLPVAVSAVSNISELPLFMDSTNAAAIEVALKLYPGLPVINSISGKRDDLDAILPLVARWGATFVALAMNDAGIAENTADIIGILREITSAAEERGIAKERIIADPVMLPVSAATQRIQAMLWAINLIDENVEIPTIIGLSNVSYGMPMRSILNSSMLSAAIAAGLSATIADPTDARIMETLQASAVLHGRDRDAKAFIAAYSDVAQVHEEQSVADSLWDDIIHGNSDHVPRHVQVELSVRGDAMEVMDEVVIAAIRQVGTLYEQRKIFLPQVMAAAEATSRALEILRQKLPDSHRQRGKILLATVHGDVHDVGKNLVRALLESHGFEVADLGKNVPHEEIIRALARDEYIAVGLSALMTTTLPAMEDAIAAIRKAYPDLPAIVGGAAVTEEFASKIGAIYAKDAIDAARKAMKLINK